MPIEIEQHEWREARALPARAELARNIQLAHAKDRLIRLAKKDGWARLHHAGKVADSKHQPGQEAA